MFLAALDEGDIKAASVRYRPPSSEPPREYIMQDCLEILVSKFPNSPRVDVLTGILMEVRESLDVALSYYQALLQEDSSNAVRGFKYDDSITRLIHIGGMAAEGWGTATTWQDRSGSRGAMRYVRHLLHRSRRMVGTCGCIRIMPAVRSLNVYSHGPYH